MEKSGGELLLNMVGATCHLVVRSPSSYTGRLGRPVSSVLGLRGTSIRVPRPGGASRAPRVRARHAIEGAGSIARSQRAHDKVRARATVRARVRARL